MLQANGWLPAAVVVAGIALSPLRPTSMRDINLVLAGFILSMVCTRVLLQRKRTQRLQRTSQSTDNDNDDDYIVRTIEELRDLMPAGASGTCIDDAKKVIGHLDDQMISFVAKSPLLYLATVDTTTESPFVSPKGDEPGFVTVQSRKNPNSPSPQHTLVIPDRPGNRLLFGLQNIVGPSKHEESTAKNADSMSNKSKRVSILFEVPGTGTTLRCGGVAKLSTDPALLDAHVARGCRPKLVILVDVDYAFFHCAKAYLRSRVWDPTSWPSEPLKVTFGRYFAKKESWLANRIDSDVTKHYQEVQKAVDGESCETEP